MFSGFGNIFITRPRHAETTDTRQDIRRHDPDREGRRRQDGEKENETPFDTNDSATVTVEALRIFLENFLKSLEKSPDKSPGKPPAAKRPGHAPEEISAPAAQSPEARSPGENIPAPVDGRAARAASVYQHVAQGVDRSAPPPAPETSGTMDSAPSADLLLAASDIRAIHKLLDDLKPLAARGVEYLTIERNDSFLASLVAAVEKAKAA